MVKDSVSYVSSSVSSGFGYFSSFFYDKGNSSPKVENETKETKESKEEIVESFLDFNPDELETQETANEDLDFNPNELENQDYVVEGHNKVVKEIVYDDPGTPKNLVEENVEEKKKKNLIDLDSFEKNLETNIINLDKINENKEIETTEDKDSKKFLIDLDDGENSTEITKNLILFDNSDDKQKEENLIDL
jgi:hypothetical protein